MTLPRPIECTEDNAVEFRAQMKAAAPEAYAFANALHKAGMLAGLRHIRVAPLPEGLPRHPGSVQPVLSLAAETRLSDLWWKRAQEAGQ